MATEADQQAKQNNYRELYREPDKGCGDYYSDSIHVTERGDIGINCGGIMFVRPLREWHRIAAAAEQVRASEAPARTTASHVDGFVQPMND